MDKVDDAADECQDCKKARIEYYTGPYTPSGMKYQKELRGFHDDLVKKHAESLHELTGKA